VGGGLVAGVGQPGRDGRRVGQGTASVRCGRETDRSGRVALAATGPARRRTPYSPGVHRKGSILKRFGFPLLPQRAGPESRVARRATGPPAWFGDPKVS